MNALTLVEFERNPSSCPRERAVALFIETEDRSQPSSYQKVSMRQAYIAHCRQFELILRERKKHSRIVSQTFATARATPPVYTAGDVRDYRRRRVLSREKIIEVLVNAVFPVLGYCAGVVFSLFTCIFFVQGEYIYILPSVFGAVVSFLLGAVSWRLKSRSSSRLGYGTAEVQQSDRHRRVGA